MVGSAFDRRVTFQVCEMQQLHIFPCEYIDTILHDPVVLMAKISAVGILCVVVSGFVRSLLILLCVSSQGITQGPITVLSETRDHRTDG